MELKVANVSAARRERLWRFCWLLKAKQRLLRLLRFRNVHRKNDAIDKMTIFHFSHRI